MDEQGIVALVDEILMEQGEYAPTELLLRLGRLAYSDYEAWRQNTVPSLEQALQGSPRRIRQALNRAAAHCQRLRLDAHTLSYHPWGAAEGLEPLRLAEDDDLGRLLATAYRPAAERLQMDLFLDTRATVLENRLREALVAGEPDEAQVALALLTDQQPDHPHLGAFESLVNGLRLPEAPPGSAAQYLAFVVDALEPAASERLGADARDYLARHWQTMSRMLERHPFDPTTPRLHRSYTAARLGYWQDVRAAIEGEQGWWHHPMLIKRLWHAAECLGDARLAFECCCRLCWEHAEYAPGALRNSLTLARDYRLFNERDEPLATPDFPAWFALRRRQPLPDVAPADTEAATTAAVVNALVAAATRNPRGPDEIEQRRALKAAHPALFAEYLQGLGPG
ncbi:hypothetical protein [Aquisalimonas sp.]|uniref:hypothetical protein n=1 Tax=Aquisalimonas sp. TaxID=1872621 RepID=UPI0025B95135|nr:hypothetical protein [Aquisalimonas sp.]